MRVKSSGTRGTMEFEMTTETPDITGLRSHFERQVRHYNERRMDDYYSDLAEDVVYVRSSTNVSSGKAAVKERYRELCERFEWWRWDSQFEYRVTGSTGIAFGPFSQVSRERDGGEVRHAGVTMVVFTYGQNGWQRIAEHLSFE